MYLCYGVCVCDVYVRYGVCAVVCVCGVHGMCVCLCYDVVCVQCVVYVFWGECALVYVCCGVCICDT